MVRESEISFQLAFEQCAIGMALVGTDGKWLRVNSSLCEMVGYTEQELLASDIKTITHKDDLKADLEYVRQMLQGTTRTYKMEKRYIRKDGKIIWINLSVSLVRDTNDTPLYFILQIENITERKQAEESLNVAMMQNDDDKKKLGSILSAIGDGISIQDTDFKVLYQNQAHKNLVGEQIGELCHVAYENNENVCDGCPVQKSFKDGEVHTAERSIITDEGKLYALITSSPLKDATGKIVAGIEVVKNVTDRKNAENALKDSEEKYRALFENSLIGIGLGKDNHVISANKATLDIFGYETFEEFARVPILDHVAPESINTIIDLRRNLDEQSSAQHFEYRIVRKDGEIRDLEASVHRITIADERYSLNTFIDVTERKRDKDELLKKNRNVSILYSIVSLATKYNNIDEILEDVLHEVLGYVESKAGGIYLIDERLDEIILRVHQGLPDEFLEKVRHVPLNNPTVEAVLENNDVFIWNPYRSEEIIQLENQHNIETTVTFKLMSREKIIGCANIVIPPGHTISEDEIHVLESIGRQVGIMIDNLRLFEETQASNEELKSLNKIKDEFLSNISHELKTPLTSIQGYSELMVDKKLGDINEQQKNALETIIRNSERLNRLIDSLIYLTMVRVGKVKYHFVQIRIGRIIDDAVWDISPLAEKKCLTIEKKIPEYLPLINGDEDKITEVLINLIDNAIKFTPPGGRITVEADAEADYLHLKVSDTGIGISSEFISSMFQEFFQVDTSTTRNYRGTGLGLYISKTIIEAHNGKIWAETEEGAGTTIHILLPT